MVQADSRISTHIVEIDVHALKLKVRGTVVAEQRSVDLLETRYHKILTLPCRQGHVHQRWSAKRQHQSDYHIVQSEGEPARVQLSVQADIVSFFAMQQRRGRNI